MAKRPMCMAVLFLAMAGYATARPLVRLVKTDDEFKKLLKHHAEVCSPSQCVLTEAHLTPPLRVSTLWRVKCPCLLILGAPAGDRTARDRGLLQRWLRAMQTGDW